MTKERKNYSFNLKPKINSALKILAEKQGKRKYELAEEIFEEYLKKNKSQL